MPKVPLGLLRRYAGKAVKGLGSLAMKPLRAAKRSFSPKEFKNISMGLLKSPGKTMKESWKHPSFGKGSALMLGAMLPSEIKRLSETGKPGGPSKAETAGSIIGDTAGWIAFSRLPMLGMLAGMTASGMGGRYAGKAIHELGQLGQKGGKSLAEKLDKTASLADYTRAYIKVLEGDTDE